VAAARAEVRLETDRLELLGASFNKLMNACSCYKHNAEWRRRGVVKMDMIDRSIPIA
jgi:hypothetical protein